MCIYNHTVLKIIQYLQSYCTYNRTVLTTVAMMGVDKTNEPVKRLSRCITLHNLILYNTAKATSMLQFQWVTNCADHF